MCGCGSLAACGCTTRLAAKSCHLSQALAAKCASMCAGSPPMTAPTSATRNTYLAYDLLIRRLEDLGHRRADGAQHYRRRRLDPAQGPRSRRGLPGVGRGRDGTVPLRHGGPCNTRPPAAEPRGHRMGGRDGGDFIRGQLAAARPHLHRRRASPGSTSATWPSYFGSLGGYDDATMVATGRRSGAAPPTIPASATRWTSCCGSHPASDEPVVGLAVRVGPPRLAHRVQRHVAWDCSVTRHRPARRRFSDLIFPHHECELAQSEAAAGAHVREALDALRDGRLRGSPRCRSR